MFFTLSLGSSGKEDAYATTNIQEILRAPVETLLFTLSPLLQRCAVSVHCFHFTCIQMYMCAIHYSNVHTCVFYMYIHSKTGFSRL